jgi:hypothetical protein
VYNGACIYDTIKCVTHRWTEGMLQGTRHRSYAGYMLRFFPLMSSLVDNYDRGFDWEAAAEAARKRQKEMKGRRILLSTTTTTAATTTHMFNLSTSQVKVTPADMITGEVTLSLSLTHTHTHTLYI